MNLGGLVMFGSLSPLVLNLDHHLHYHFLLPSMHYFSISSFLPCVLMCISGVVVVLMESSVLATMSVGKRVKTTLVRWNVWSWWNSHRYGLFGWASIRLFG